MPVTNHKYERQGVIHVAGDWVPYGGYVTLCEYKHVRFHGEELTPVPPVRVTTCLACLATSR